MTGVLAPCNFFSIIYSWPRLELDASADLAAPQTSELPVNDAGHSHDNVCSTGRRISRSVRWTLTHSVNQRDQHLLKVPVPVAIDGTAGRDFIVDLNARCRLIGFQRNALKQRAHRRIKAYCIVCESANDTELCCCSS